MVREVDETSVQFGRATAGVADELSALHYPVTKQQLIASIGDHEIRFDGETKAFLSEIVQGVPQAKFRDARQAALAVDQRWTRIAHALRDIERGATQIEGRSRKR